MQEIKSHDPDQEIYEHWEQHTKTMGGLFPDSICPYSHPNDNNIQITPYKGSQGIEYDVRDFLDPEPQTRSAQRREELALGQFEQTQPRNETKPSQNTNHENTIKTPEQTTKNTTCPDERKSKIKIKN